ncbi:MAG: DUF6883 domain-containing protein [Phycisphaerae bacterium]
MLLPNGNRAIVDIAKLRDYCLCPTHPVGKHKSRVFWEALALQQSDAAFLRTALERAASEMEAELGEKDEFGQRYVIEFKLMRGVRSATVLSAWIVRTGELQPRLTTCFVR